MDINLLVKRLQHGESYVLHNALGEPYQENRPPTQLNIRAAETIIACEQKLQQAASIIQNLQHQITQLTEQNELLQKAKHSSTGST